MEGWDDDDKTVIGEKPQTVPPEPSRQRAYVVVLVGPNLGETFELTHTSEVGRTSTTPVQLMDPEVSRRHARFVVDGEQVLVEDLGSTNGTFVNGDRVLSPRPLEDGDKVQVGTSTILKFSFHDALDRAFQQKMYDAALRDGLTGAFNKRHFKERMEAELAYAVRHRTLLALILFDLDRFKALNDAHGHLAGDHVLEQLGQLVTRAMRKEDFFARWGGEELAILSRGIDLEGGRRFAERLRGLVEGYEFVFDGVRLPVTASFGVAALPECDVRDTDVFTQCADEALYAAKRSGRNRVEVYGR